VPRWSAVQSQSPRQNREDHLADRREAPKVGRREGRVRANLPVARRAWARPLRRVAQAEMVRHPVPQDQVGAGALQEDPMEGPMVDPMEDRRQEVLGDAAAVLLHQGDQVGAVVHRVAPMVVRPHREARVGAVVRPLLGVLGDREVVAARRVVRPRQGALQGAVVLQLLEDRMPREVRPHRARHRVMTSARSRSASARRGPRRSLSRRARTSSTCAWVLPEPRQPQRAPPSSRRSTRESCRTRHRTSQRQSS
jgi:hypothetical protein